MGMYKTSLIADFDMMSALIKLQMWQRMKKNRHHYLRFQLKSTKTWNSSHVLFMKILFSGNKNKSQNPIIS